MKILITGGTGFIGSRLAFAGLESGHQVKVLGQVNTRAEEENRRQLQNAGIPVFLLSVAEKNALPGAVAGCDIVFHLAAAQHEAHAAAGHFHAVNVEGTKSMLEASAAAGVKRFVHGSTIGVYGSGAEDNILDEQSPLEPDNVYGLTKCEAEKIVFSFRDKIPVSVVRISETYGPGDRRLLKLFRAIQKRIFFMIGTGRNKHQPVYIDDLINGLFLIGAKPEAVGEVFVLTGPEVLTTAEMVAIIAEKFEVPSPDLRMPLGPFLAAAWVFEKIFMPLGIRPPLFRRRLDFFKKNFYFSPVKASNRLGFRAETGFARGAAETIRWYKEQGLLS